MADSQRLLRTPKPTTKVKANTAPNTVPSKISKRGGRRGGGGGARLHSARRSKAIRSQSGSASDALANAVEVSLATSPSLQSLSGDEVDKEVTESTQLDFEMLESSLAAPESAYFAYSAQ
jgi:hypothetical protein